MRKTKQVPLNLEKPSNKKGFTLVGKLLTGKNLNKGIMLSMIRKGWQLEEEALEIHDFDHVRPIFLFRFEKEEDYLRILKGRPWSIQGFMLNIQLWEDYMVLSEVKFNTSPFWIQFHGLPIEAFDKGNAIILGEQAGEVLMYEDPKVNDKLNRSFIRVRCLVNLDNPLESGFWIPRKDKSPTWVSLKYERLQNFCYHCGRIGHDEKTCKNKNCDEHEAKTDDEFGHWIRTPQVKTIDEHVIVHKSDWVEAPHVRQSSATPHRNHHTRAESESANFGKNRSRLDSSISPNNSLSIFADAPTVTTLKGINANISNSNGVSLQLSGQIGGIILHQKETYGGINGGIIKDQNNISNISCRKDTGQMGRPLTQGIIQRAIIEEITNEPLENEPINATQKIMVSSPPHSPAPLSSPIKPSQAIVPYGTLSPLSQVTINLQNVNLKRKESVMEDVPSPKRKKKLEFEEVPILQNNRKKAAKSVAKANNSRRSLKRGTKKNSQMLENVVKSTNQGTQEIDFPHEWLVINGGNIQSNSSDVSFNAGGWMKPTTGSQ